MKDLIHLPEKSRDAIYDAFDPVLIMNESVESNLPRMLELILTFEGSDEEYVEKIKAESQLIVGEVVCDIEEGFIEGMNDVNVFLKENATVVVKAANSPEKAALASMMAVPQIMKYVESATTQYKKDKEAGTLPAKRVATPD